MATDDKYDRQIRIWGIEGQKQIAESHVLMLGCTGTGAETLKNLVLPGFGMITIVSDKKVKQEDFGTNFYLTMDPCSLNENIAQETLKNLIEINEEDVKGQFFDADPSKFMETHRDVQDTANIIIADGLNFDTCLVLDKYVSNNQNNNKDQKLVIIKTCGLVGYVRLCLGDFTSCESKIDRIFRDYRIMDPWPEYLEWVQSLDIENASEGQHIKIPYYAILVHLTKKWLDSGKKFDKDGKKDFRQFIADHAIFEPNLAKYGRWEGFEENFKEASENFGSIIFSSKSHINGTEELNETMDWYMDKKNKNDSKRGLFFYMVQALGEFRSKYGCYPLSGELEDCISSTQNFLKLKEIFRNKHLADVKLFEDLLRNILQPTIYIDNFTDEQKYNKFTHEYCKIFCKNYQSLQAFTTRTLEEEWKNVEFDTESYDIEDFPSGSPYWYWGLRAIDEFKSKNSREAGPEDYEQVLGFANNLVQQNGHTEYLAEFNNDSRNLNIVCKEQCRYKGLEQAMIASIIGGQASSEILKFTTRNYVCFNNTFIFDGISSQGYKPLTC